MSPGERITAHELIQKTLPDLSSPSNVTHTKTTCPDRNDVSRVPDTINMEPFYRRRNPDGGKRGSDVRGQVTCADDSPAGRIQGFVNGANDAPEERPVIQNDLDTRKADMTSQLDQDPVAFALLTSQIARQLAIIGDEVNDIYRREFTAIMADVNATLRGNHGNLVGSVSSFIYKGLSCEMTVKRLSSLLSQITVSEQSQNTALRDLCRQFPRSVCHFFSRHGFLFLTSGVVVTSCLAAVLLYRKSGG